MTSVTDLIEAVDNLDIEEEGSWAVDDTKVDLIEIQKDQMLHGLRADGKPIGKYRNPVYAAMKHSMNPLAGEGNMDWRLTGALFKEIFVDVRRDEIVIDSADTKVGGLIESFGDPFGLTDDNQQKYIDQSLEEVFLNRVKTATGL